MTVSSTTEILQEMARLTVLSGRISDVQIKNLQMFPMVFFNSVSESKIAYDLETKKTIDDSPTFSNSVVSYYLTVDESDNNSLDRRFLALEKAVRALFWKDVVVEVYFNDQIRYKSKRG